MSLKDITITGSIGSIATQSYGQRTYVSSTDEQSFPIEHITGSDAKAWPNFVQGTDYTVGLVVNVTQSWSGSNVTPLGYVPYVHNTMEEFIDGEFSGSNYVVTDGNLNDAQCEQFLTVNTTPVKYSIFAYFQQNTFPFELNHIPVSTFLNANTAPRNGEMLIYYNNFSAGNTKGVYAKIARIDGFGNDNTLSLQELRQFNYVDAYAGPGFTPLKIVFDVINITEYPNYYLYKVTTNTTDNVPAETNLIDYPFSASSAMTSSIPGLEVTYIDQWTVYNSGSNYWDNYANLSFALTPNTTIYYTASIDIYNPDSLDQYITFGLWENTYAGSNIFYNPVQTQTKKIFGFNSSTFTLSGSYSFIGTQDVQYHLEVVNSPSFPVSLSNTFWIITQSQAPFSPATSSVVIEPYLLSNFANSDCDVLINNASQNDISGFYREVLYENGGTIPSNFQQIISGTAEYAQVNDYLFNANANVLPRYEGVRVTQQYLNKWTQGDISPSLTPSVQSLKTSVAYSTTVIDQAPIKMNASKAFVKYYIDEAGNTITPNVDKNSLYIAQGNFPTNENLDVNFAIQGNTNAPQYKPILRGGARLEPIIYNQIRDYTNPPMTWSPTMSFTDNNPLSTTTINDYTATLKAGVPYPNNYITHNSPPSGIFMSQIIQKGSAITTEIGSNLNYYKITNNTFLTERLDLKFEVALVIINQNPWSVLVGGSIIKSSSLGLNRYWYEAPRITVGAYSSVWYRFSNTEYASDQQINDKYSVGLFTDDGTTDPNYFGRVLYSPDSTFKVSTNPLPTLPISTSGLFQTTSAFPNYIFTTSSQLIGFYNNNETRQVSITGSLFNPTTLPFTLQVGDEFRFEGDESKTFMVKYFDNIESGSSPLFLNSESLYIEFTRPISGSGIDINKFLLRRYVDDAESIIFTNTSDKRISGSLIISPEYKSTLLNNNINTYIEDLTQKGLI